MQQNESAFATKNSIKVCSSNPTDSSFLIDNVCKKLNNKDFIFLSAEKTKLLLTTTCEDGLNDWEEFKDSWTDLITDQYMADGGTYRSRRYATLSAEANSCFYKVEAHQPHYQSLSYNHLNGGIARHFEAIKPKILNSKTMSTFVRFALNIFSRLSPYSKWHIEVHQFRIDAHNQSIAKPTPEGVHRDGVNFVVMVMINRKNVVNGVTDIYDAEKRHIAELTLNQSFDLAIVNDERTFHGVTPIIQLDTNKPAIRDVLVITFRKKSE